jgi:hypothetical protein
MKITKVNPSTDISKMHQDKTDWKKVYQKSQSIADIEAKNDKENPIIKNGRVRKLNESTKP